MKRTISLILVLAALISLAACGEAKAPVDLNAIYEGYLETLPEMMLIEDSLRKNFFGIDNEDCVQVITAICANGLRVDEVWLIEAKDATALSRLETLAQTRLEAKAQETISYAPDQYAIVQKARLILEGNYLILLVSPDVDTLEADLERLLK